MYLSPFCYLFYGCFCSSRLFLSCSLMIIWLSLVIDLDSFPFIFAYVLLFFLIVVTLGLYVTSTHFKLMFEFETILKSLNFYSSLLPGLGM